MSAPAKAEPLWPEAQGPREIDVVGLGQCSLDHVGRVDEMPRLAGKARLGSYERMPGGQVATALLACARLGLRTAYEGTVGDDDEARLVLEPLRKSGVDLRGLRTVRGAPTQTALILVHAPSGERSVLWHRDARLALKPADLSREAIARARVLLLDAADLDAAIWAAGVARAAGCAVVLDVDAPAPDLEKLLATVDFPIVSQSFAETFFGRCSKRAALGALCGLGARLAAVTLGAAGALARQGERVIPSPGFAVAARDTTGAGDAFHAGFAWALLEGHDAQRALRVANATAALNCTAPGAQGGLPDRVALEAFLATHEPGPWQDPDADR